MSETDEQLDLFSAAGIARGPYSPVLDRPEPITPEALDDGALVAAIPQAGIADAAQLAAEAARRRLPAAVPALDQLCRRFTGFGLSQVVPEQVAALVALAEIGGAEAAQAVVGIIARGVVQGPAVKIAVAAAAHLGASLPVNVVVPLLRHADPSVRADACRCSRFRPEIVAILTDLLHDLHRDVADQAACALGRMGQTEARSALLRLLRDAPTDDIIEAITDIADEEAIVLLGRIARSGGSLAEAARSALAAIDHPQAARLLKTIASEAGAGC